MTTRSVMSHHTASARNMGHLSRLPAEIRNLIYSYPLTPPEAVEVTRSSTHRTIFRASDIEAQAEEVATFLDLAEKENASCITKLTVSFNFAHKLQILIDQALTDAAIALEGFSLWVTKTSREMSEILAHAGVKREAVEIEKLELRDVYPDASRNQLLEKLGGIFMKSIARKSCLSEGWMNGAVDAAPADGR
ncbi:hypothetical protein LTR37_017092 [Vermiconidia calcicola]|uniref:Uncharacterized protein n=1 Tax=Vermiconidia calcicola TaxID=1690605 RepID=A0ACC3MNT4_9PEZI|nr:hypothetical protein LTR37_017092 [Vermiconidia calcicola]